MLKSEKEVKMNKCCKSKEEEIAEHILKESKLRFHTIKSGEEMTFIYDEIIVVVEKSNILIEYEQLQKCKEYFLQNQGETILAKSFLMFMEFKNELENRIKEEFKYKYNLKMELELIRVNNEEKGIYDIQCIYNFFPPVNGDYIESFKDENILINKTKSNNQGFEYLLSEINNEKYEDCLGIEEKSK